MAPGMGVVTDHFFLTSRLEKMWKRKGVMIRNTTDKSESGNFESVTLQILAPAGMNGSVIQCGAIGSRRNSSSFYSRFAVLQVELPPEPSTQSSSTEESSTTTPSH